MDRDYGKIREDSETRSIWDEDVDMEEVSQLTPSEKHRLFPNDFAPNGKPYGDF